jgi:mRNA-degrading endonuclease HigB of HigAB toxin-antitoxin module
MKQGVWVATATALALLNATAFAKDRRADVQPRTFELQRSLFSGSESPFYDFGGLRPDCTIPVADVRIVKPPAHGEVRFEETKTVVTAQKQPLQKRCFGKTVDAVRMFYKANADFVGKDRVVIDIDGKAGAIWRVAFTVDIR